MWATIDHGSRLLKIDLIYNINLKAAVFVEFTGLLGTHVPLAIKLSRVAGLSRILNSSETFSNVQNEGSAGQVTHAVQGTARKLTYTLQNKDQRGGRNPGTTFLEHVSSEGESGSGFSGTPVLRQIVVKYIYIYIHYNLL